MNLETASAVVADALFEDFASADFANKKRSIAVNQRQHKIVPLSPPVTADVVAVETGAMPSVKL